MMDLLKNALNYLNSSEEMRGVKADYDPRIIISHGIQAEIETLRKIDPDTLILYLFNKERFLDIDAIHLYEAFNGMEKYSFGKAFSAVDVLTTRYEDNPDALLARSAVFIGWHPIYIGMLTCISLFFSCPTC